MHPAKSNQNKIVVQWCWNYKRIRKSPKDVKSSPSIKGDAKFRNFSNCIFFPLNSANFHSWHGLKNPKTVTFVLFSANLETTELPLSKLLKSFSVIWQDFYTIFFPNFQWLKCVARKNHNKKCSHIFWLFYLE